MGNPRAFEVIGKTQKTADLEVYTADNETAALILR
jgi:hypothetical protein